MRINKEYNIEGMLELLNEQIQCALGDNSDSAMLYDRLAYDIAEVLEELSKQETSIVSEKPSDTCRI